MNNKFERGQALVLVLLSLAVVLTIVLFVLSRSITDIAVSTNQEASVRAFSAAEAGIENILVIGTAPAGSVTIGNATYTASIGDYAGGTSALPKDFPYPTSLSSGDSAITWFISHDASGNIVPDKGFTGGALKVCWGNSGTAAGSGTTPAIEVSVYYESTPRNISTLKIARAVVDPNVARTSVNSFSSPDAGTCTIAGNNYEFQKTIDFSTIGATGIPVLSQSTQGGLIFARVRLLYNTDVPHVLGTTVNGVAGDSDSLPSQGQGITSTGVAGTGQAGVNTTRKVTVFQAWGETPLSARSILSPSGITQ